MGMYNGLVDIVSREAEFPELIKLTERFNRQSEEVTMHLTKSHPWDIPADDKTWLRARDKLSINGTEFFDLATEDEKRRLSILEMGTWWQGFLIFERIVTEYYCKLINDGSLSAFPEVVEYIHHFCREEINHSMVFEKAMRHFSVEAFPRPENMNLEDTYNKTPPTEIPLFNIYLTLVVEWVADLYQRMDVGDETHPLAVAVVKEHQKEEARHIAWAQQMCKSLSHEQDSFLAETRQMSAPFMRGFLDTGVVNMECYARVGFEHPEFQNIEKLCMAVIGAPRRRELHQQMMKPVFDFWLDAEIYHPDFHSIWVNADFGEDIETAKERRAQRDARKQS